MVKKHKLEKIRHKYLYQLLFLEAFNVKGQKHKHGSTETAYCVAISGVYFYLCVSKTSHTRPTACCQ